LTPVPLLLDFGIISGILISALILFFLLQKKDKQTHQLLLILFFILVLFIFLEEYSALHRLQYLYATSFLFTNGAGFLIAPLIYFYILSLFVPYTAWKKKWWPHILVFLFFFLVVSIPIILEQSLQYEGFKHLEFFKTYSEEIYVFEMLFLAAYIVFSLQLLNQFRNQIENFYSDLKDKDLSWSVRLLWGILFFIIGQLFMSSFILLTGLNPNFERLISLLIQLSIVIYLGYLGFYQSSILIPSFLLNNYATTIPSSDSKSAPTTTNLKTENKLKVVSIFSESEKEKIKLQLEISLTKKQYYLNPSLTLSELAKEVATTDKKLSAFINQHLQTNFYELINYHRIEEFKKQLSLSANANLTIWGIANNCGFKSKTSFNRIFKKQTGMTPTAYKNGKMNMEN